MLKFEICRANGANFWKGTIILGWAPSGAWAPLSKPNRATNAKSLCPTFGGKTWAPGFGSVSPMSNI